MDVLLIGFGCIGRALCTFRLPIKSLVIIDRVNYQDLINELFDAKNLIYDDYKHDVKFIQMNIVQSNYLQLSNILRTTTIVMDCSYNIDTLDLIKILPPNVTYINTSTENWNAVTLPTLKARQDEISKWYNETKPPNSILLDCGMNPGLVSMWAHDCCQKFNLDKSNVTKCIISEVDTQRAKVSRVRSEFVSTWSPDGFLEEIHAPTEGYSLGTYYSNSETSGYKTVSVSLRPDSSIFYGHTVRHAEAISLHKFFPSATIMYVYKAPDEAVASLFEYQTPIPIKKKRIMYSSDVIDGIDELGVLISDQNKIIWYGSKLSNEIIKTYPLNKYLNATSLQVVSGIWMGINMLEYCRHNNIYRLLTPEDVIDLPQFPETLSRINNLLMMDIVDLSSTQTGIQYMSRLSFDDHKFKN